jgi:predicted RNA-binding Zn ribbon-like protein
MVTRADVPPAGSTERSEPDYTFDFCGGHLALDFTNTVGSRGAAPKEHFNTYGDLLAWAEARAVVSKSEATRLKRAAARDADAARRALRRGIELREALYRVFARRASGKPPGADDLACINRFVTDTYRGAQLLVDGGGLTLATDTAADVLERPIATVVRAAVELLTGEEAALVGTCADETCGWLFLDTTRNRTRRWCDMKVCGNRNKVRRFRGTGV